VGMMAQSASAVGVTSKVAKVCDARTYGAKGDGATKDTLAIQAAVDDCAKAGGGTVKLSGGTFLTGPVLLKSHITLEIEKGAVLLGSPDRADYPMVTFARNQTVQPLVSAVNAKNVAIVGEGTIDGNGKVWWDYIIGAKEAGVLNEKVTACYRDAYGDEPFVRLLEGKSLPDTKNVNGTNMIEIAWRLDPRTGRLIVLSAEDNLVKGASGQAIQSMNLICGFPETAGLI